MSDETARRIFSKNLRHILALKGKRPVDLVTDLKLPSSTVSNWVTGIKMPRMGNVERLADYLGCTKSDLIEDKGDAVPESYYMNDEAKELAQFLYDNPKYRILFDASRKVKPEDIEFVKKMIDRVTD